MTTITRAASIPLILSDPYFSIWSPADHLYDCDTQSWTGKEQPIRGYVKIGNRTFRFMGEDSVVPVISQRKMTVTATQTNYIFENDYLLMEVSFATNLNLQDLYKISEPVTAITIRAISKIGNEQVEVSLAFSEDICRDTEMKTPLHWHKITTATEKIAWMGKGRQSPLDSTGDLIDINWGYLYLAAPENLEITYRKKRDFLVATYPVSSASDKLENATATSILVAYDDTHAINYFGTPINALWKEKYSGICDLLASYLRELPERLTDCQQIDQLVEDSARQAGGKTLELITAFSYRQSICAHKLIRDPEGEIIFLSKECSSNGCIGTVDISYPSSPLYLLWQTELLKGMLRPIYKFADMPVWEFEFAPHDVGCYPYATGQLYGEVQRPGSLDWSDRESRDTPYPYYQLPPGQNIYNFQQQMPIEECGNMVIMAAATYLRDGDGKFFGKYLPTNLKWADYLAEYGQDPENQLCTDDFAGHLAHNCNLSLKAITALGLFGKALKKYGEKKAGEKYSQKAQQMAKTWQEMAITNQGHTPLAFGLSDSWSLKYNIVWDELFALDLFTPELMAKELIKYQKEANRFGTPLDQRETYTKADWILWVSIFAKDKLAQEQLIAPVADYLQHTPTRVPFSDWYDTLDGHQMNFKNRSVVGAMFMPILHQRLKK